jgi:class 3 adenylate cyclase
MPDQRPRSRPVSITSAHMTERPSRGRPETKYVETAKGFVAYQVFGIDSPDILFITNWLTNVDAIWDEPSAARYLDRLGALGRVIMADKRGSGVSDPSSRGYIDPIDDTIVDVRAVLDTLGSNHTILVGDTEGGMLACVLAATFPDRFPTLILINSLARMARAPDYQIGAPPHVMEALSRDWQASYGVNADTLALTAPSVADDPRLRAWYPRFQRLAMAPSVARQALKWIQESDIRAVLPAIQAHTLVIHRRDARFHRLAFGEYLAANIPGAELAIVDGADTIPYHAGDTSEILDHVERWITGRREPRSTNRLLTTVLISDIVGSTERASRLGDQRWLDLLGEHDRIVRSALERFEGSEIDTTGDGFVANFDSPHRAIQCGLAMTDDLRALGLTVRVGIHTGEIEIREGEVGGLAMHIAARVMQTSDGGVIVSGTVKDLVVGSRLNFTECGRFELKGLPGSWELYEVREVTSASAPV